MAKTGRPNHLTTVESCAWAGIVLAGALLAGQEARADGYSECNQILTQDILNRAIRTDSSRSTSSAETRAAFYQQTDTEAWEAFDNARSEARKNGTKIDAEFHYGIIGGELGIDVNSEKQVSEKAFREKFNKAKATYSSSTSSKTASSRSLMSHYASYVRDPGTVSAWKECVTKTRETNLYAFASRDPAGQTFINVMWVPGPLAGSVPTISIAFVTDGDAEGLTIHSNPEEQLAMGSGRNFAVSCGATCDNGFRVVVNGTLKNAAGNPTSSFTSAVDVPPAKLPASSTPVMAGVWRHVLDASSVGAGTLIDNITFAARGENTYDVLAGRGRDAARGLATLTGHHLLVNFETPLSGGIGQIDWELNPAFTEGAGTVTLYVQQLDTPLVASSKIVRIE